jgi:DNA repair exonuclease SbcCD nuclease subunit
MSRHFLSDEAQSRFTHDRIDAIRRIGELARDHEAQFVVVAGDVFESNQVDRQTVVRALEAMDSVPVPLFLLPGNHDPLDAATVYRSATFSAKKPENVLVLEDSQPIEPAGAQGVEVVGAPWDSKRPFTDLAGSLFAALEPSPPDVTRIAVAHGVVDTLAPDPDAPALIRVADAEKALGDGRIHYLALGDRHSATDVGGTGGIWYSGTPVATDFGEQAPGRVLLVDVAPGSPPQVTEIPLYADDAWRFVDESYPLNGPEDVEALARSLDAHTHKESVILRLSLVGELSIAAHARLNTILDDYGDSYASIRLWERHTNLVILPDSLDAESLELSGYAKKAWDELAEGAKRAGEADRESGDALALLYRLASGGSAS